MPSATPSRSSNATRVRKEGLAGQVGRSAPCKALIKNSVASNRAPCALPAARQSTQPETKLSAQRSIEVSHRTAPKLAGVSRSRTATPTREASASGQIAIIRRFSPVRKFRMALKNVNNAATRNASEKVATGRKLKDKKNRLAIAAAVSAIQPRSQRRKYVVRWSRSSSANSARRTTQAVASKNVMEGKP